MIPFTVKSCYSGLLNSEVHIARYSVKQTGFLVLLGTCTVQNLHVDACNSTGMHSTSLWLVFLASIQQGRAMEHAFLALNSMSMHCQAYQKYIGGLQNTDASIFWTCSNGPYGVCIGRVPLYKIGKVDAFK